MTSSRIACPSVGTPPSPTPPPAARKPSFLRGLFFFTDCRAMADLPKLFQNCANAHADGELDRASRGRAWRAGRDGRPMQQLGEPVHRLPLFRRSLNAPACSCGGSAFICRHLGCGRPDKLPPRTRHERRWPLWDSPTTSRRKAYGMGRVMSREVISWIAAVAVAALFVAIVLWLRTFALAPG
jgi:hypothetical protein